MVTHYYDYEIRWKNYRGFEDTDWLSIKPLTILIGPNNAGKTSVFSPLLLLNQTVHSPDGITPLLTRGPVVDAGHYKDIIHGQDTNKELFLGVRYHVHNLRANSKPVGNYAPGAIGITLAQPAHTREVVLQKSELFDIFRRLYLSHTRTSEGYVLSSDALGKLRKNEERAISKTPPLNFLFDPSDTLGAYRRYGSTKAVQTQSDQEETLPPKYSEAFSEYLRTISYALEDTRQRLATISYVGPLRARLKRYYDVSTERTPLVGSMGENTANLVRRHKAQMSKDLNKWVRAFEFGDRLVVKRLPESLFSLYFQRGNPPVITNIADAGFGASQVLPLIVQAIMAPKNTVTIAEQPEIHLNPKLQSLLADLFVKMATSDHRVIVETHSEHLLLRLRRLVAEGEIDHDDIALYFVEREDGVSTVRAITIDAYGNIPSDEWPKGFFEDSLKESLALATTQSKRRDKPRIRQ
jgi:predicted ATPase